MHNTSVAITYGITDSERLFIKKQSHKGSPIHRGMKGELNVHKKLLELDNNFHVFCGVRIRTRSRKKVQIDFVVVSKRGIISIEVKNWSEEFLLKEQAYRKKYGGKSPHFQADMSGSVLWVVLKSSTLLNNPPVTKVLLATHGNMQYDPEYKYVNVKNLNNIIPYIQTRSERLSDEEVKKIIFWLGDYLPIQYKSL